VTARTSIPPPSPPQRTLATRVLASFAVALVAFAVTVGFSVVGQRQAAKDSEELSKGFVPVALKLGELRAVQTTLTTLVEKSPGERDPSTRLVIETLVKVRRATFADARAAMTSELYEHGSGETRELALLLTGELDAAEAQLKDERALFEQLWTALDRGDADAVNRVLLSVGPLEIECTKRLRALTDRLNSSMIRIGADAEKRERRAIWQLVALAALTLALGVGVSLHARRLLQPLAKMTERAQAVARGDLTAKDPMRTDDEIGQLSVAFERMVSAVARAQSRAVANERLAAIGKMAAHVTHEIRNPLSSIGLNIELLEEDLSAQGASAEARGLLGSITREVQRLEHLSEEYLRVARLPQPRMEADDVSALVKEVASFSGPEIARAGCKLEVTVDEPIPPVLFDEAQIRQALLNLLRNAREAMPDGGTIDLTARSEGMSVVIAVEDRGVGIPEDIRARVFDPFFSTKGEGTGLGLAITRQIVEAHGGSLACEPRDGGGTIFRLSLPIAPARASAANVAARAS
jgi:signal transduction histidine kinase